MKSWSWKPQPTHRRKNVKYRLRSPAGETNLAKQDEVDSSEADWVSTGEFKRNLKKRLPQFYGWVPATGGGTDQNREKGKQAEAQIKYKVI